MIVDFLHKDMYIDELTYLNKEGSQMVRIDITDKFKPKE